MDSEQALLQRAHRFEEQALVEIYDHFSPGVYRYAMRLLGCENLAEDCVSETFSRFLAVIKCGNGPNKYLQAYLYRIAHNWITDHYRRTHSISWENEANSHFDPNDDPQQIASQNIDGARVRHALERLTADQRQVIALKYLEEWKNDEIAEALAKPVGAVKALHHRAINSLRRLLISGDDPL